ncbi:MAG TPA: type II secretion system secretin GspD [Burkholderiales bacterium]|nr:type II secretion system secretin GspD [Burkholderiales bacterium]
MLLLLVASLAICVVPLAHSQERPKDAAKVPARPADSKPAARTATPAVKGMPAEAPPPSPAAPSRPPREAPDVVTLNFVNADIEGVVKVVSEITGKNFVIDPRVKGTVNIVSAKPMPRSRVYDVFLAALRLQGFAAVEDRGLVKVVPEADAKLHSSPTQAQGETGGISGDRIETRVFTLKYESAVQALPILRPLIAPSNTITAYQNNNTLVITDYANNLERIADIIDAIDQPNANDPVVIPLKYASAVDVAATVNRLFAEAAQAQGAAEPTQRFTVVADARSNSLLARSGDTSRLARLRKFIAILDSPTNAGGNIHVVYLKNAEAVKLAEILRAIYQGEGGTTAAAPSSTPTAQRTSLGANAPMGTPQSQSQLGGQGTSGVGAASSFSINQAQTTPTAPGIIQADASTNSIIITAPDAIYNNLRAALDKLDVRRAQVYVEALIAEVGANKAAEFGIQWQDLNGYNKNSAQPFGGTNFGGAGQNIIGIAQNPGTAGQGLNVGIIKGQVNVPGVGQILNLGFLVRALQTDSSSNILATPTLLTLDNEEAVILIGQNVPFVTGQYALSGGATTPTPFQTVERHDVGVTLRVKPQISEGGTVRLQIYQEVSSIEDATNPAGVITNKRAVESTILVDDGRIVVIGGLIQDTVLDGVQKVPVLGDIPILGALFRYKTRSHVKTNLMVFLRPTLVRSSQRADEYTGERYDYILGEQQKAKPAHDVVLPDVQSPLLPPREQTPALQIEVKPYNNEGRK